MPPRARALGYIKRLKLQRMASKETALGRFGSPRSSENVGLCRTFRAYPQGNSDPCGSFGALQAAAWDAVLATLRQPPPMVDLILHGN